MAYSSQNGVYKQLIEKLIKESADDLRYGISLNNKEKQHNRFIEEALKAHNKYRQKHGVEPLIHNPDITRIAQEYADILASKKSLSYSRNKFNDKLLGEALGFFYDSRVEYFPG